MEGHGDLISRLIVRIPRVTIWVIGVINLLTKSTDPPSRVQGDPSLPEAKPVSGRACVLLSSPARSRPCAGDTGAFHRNIFTWNIVVQQFSFGLKNGTCLAF